MRTVAALLAILSGILCGAAPTHSRDAAPEDWTPAEVARAADDSWSVEDLGRGVHVFRWWPGFYVSPFLVGDTGAQRADGSGR